MSFNDSWTRAESELFRAFQAATGHKENKQAFRGYLPMGAPDTWMLAIGDGGLGDETRFYGAVVSFDELTVQGVAQCQYSSRDKAQAWAMQILGKIKETNNFKGVGNLTNVFLTGNHPSVPTPEPQDGGGILWVVTINLQVIYKTGT